MKTIKKIIRAIYRGCRKFGGKGYRLCKKVIRKIHRCYELTSRYYNKIYYLSQKYGYKVYRLCEKVVRKIHCCYELTTRYYNKIYYLGQKYGYKVYRKSRQIAGKVYSWLKKKYIYIKTKKHNVKSFKSWCGKNYHVIESKRSITINPPLIISSDKVNHVLEKSQGNLPEVYLAKLKNVMVIECTDMVIPNRRIALYDEIALDTYGKYEERHNYSGLIFGRQKNPNKLCLKYKKNEVTKLPETAIHFCKDYSFNYFHWLIEALPRLSIIEKFPELDSIPLLIDSNLKPQQLEALQILTKGKRELITLELGQAYHIKNLFYPSCLSHVHNNYYHPVDFNNDIVISPDAIRYLRKNFLPFAKNLALKNKYYISRRNRGVGRRLLNDDEIETYLSEHDFTIIYPEQMSFVEQIQLFSQAKIIIGASGSAFANMIFSPPNCQIYILSANNEQVNFNLFSTLANVAQLQLNYVLGEDQVIEYLTKTHNSFKVPIHLIESILRKEQDNLLHLPKTRHSHLTMLQ